MAGIKMNILKMIGSKVWWSRQNRWSRQSPMVYAKVWWFVRDTCRDPKANGYTKVPRSVSYRHCTPSPTVEHAKVRRSAVCLRATLFEVERKNIKVYDVTSRDRYCYVNNNNFNSRILRWIPSRRGIFFEKVRKTEEVESIFVYLLVGIG